MGSILRSKKISPGGLNNNKIFYRTHSSYYPESFINFFWICYRRSGIGNFFSYLSQFEINFFKNLNYFKRSPVAPWSVSRWSVDMLLFFFIDVRQHRIIELVITQTCLLGTLTLLYSSCTLKYFPHILRIRLNTSRIFSEYAEEWIIHRKKFLIFYNAWYS
jgi:hypothetical protein